MKVVIKRNEYDEYEAPTGTNADGSMAIYYTDDKQDAIDTVKLLTAATEIVVRRGTYPNAGAKRVETS